MRCSKIIMSLCEYIEDHIDPADWAKCEGDLNLNTLYYGEYMNYGLGVGIALLVTWLGYHVITDPAEVSKFTVAHLIQGGEWLDSTEY
ncbi:unnamed protein product [Camellia sinensis]